jgi:hypothetical protein
MGGLWCSWRAADLVACGAPGRVAEWVACGAPGRVAEHTQAVAIAPESELNEHARDRWFNGMHAPAPKQGTSLLRALCSVCVCNFCGRVVL